LAISALRRSPGSLCTTPPGTRELITEPTVAGQGDPYHLLGGPTVPRYAPRSRSAKACASVRNKVGKSTYSLPFST
jgi:hypothetical protein